ncbi:Extracellular ligand-binding receptor [Denitrovibrio acetiphilus DSM 12809]|uniref:Extracellular ligand-binding receptor n=1 Tax=Denitrovibrio acetiphilus (strain DSM 12809 / NBRC 114555 / N2460) TaxID=522772 RepID=D4H8D0_DENA2|nr:branched-chain amino acid ABC transporter substrate-binding protein [Denitrovibrio acetiphilus]ADD68279.1 Extracellular ligand-binding receptor [Denitrovibrio acetiphilus DSM 12809]
MKKLFTLSLAVLVSALFAATAFAADTIKVGVQAPTTGQYANEGQGIDNATRLMVEQYNAKGGLLGKKLEVFTCDDEGQAMKAAICAKELVNKGVIMVIGSYTSSAAEAAQKTYYRAGVLQTTDGTSDSLVKNGYWTFFRNSNPNSANAQFTAEYMVNVAKFKRIAIVSDYSSYAQGLADAVTKEIKAVNGNIVYEGKIKAGSQNFTPVLTKVKSLDPDVIYFSGYYADGGLLRAQQKQLGIDAAFIGGDANDNVDFRKLAGGAAEGAMIVNVPTPDMLPYDLAKNFLADYRAKFGKDIPSIWALLNADGLLAFLTAIEKTGTTDTKKLSEWLHSNELNGMSGKLKWDDKGERVGSAFMVYKITADGSYDVAYPKQ